MKIYRRHYCGSAHRYYRTAAACIWRKALWISGDGPYALLAWCGDLTISLHPTRARAEATMIGLADKACGSRCYNEHELIILTPAVLTREGGRS